MSHKQLVAWGWRIPFVFGALGALASGYLRRRLEGTAHACERNREGVGMIAGPMKHKRAVATVPGLTAFSTYMQIYLVNSAGMNAKSASAMVTVALVVFMCLQPVFGRCPTVSGESAS